MFLLREPSPDVASRFLEESHHTPVSYDRRGGRGFRVDDSRTTIGSGRPCFVSAVRALRAWRHLEFDWVRVVGGDTDAAVGTTVAVAVRHLGFWSLNGARVVSVSGSEADDEFAFAYRTLTNHAECGEERFRLQWDRESDRVTYDIHAISRPRAPLAWLGYPIVRILQARFRRDSARALERAISI